MPTPPLGDVPRLYLGQLQLMLAYSKPPWFLVENEGIRALSVYIQGVHTRHFIPSFPTKKQLENAS